jgi:glutamyl/glutaminyl-tRNA synthetase
VLLFQALGATPPTFAHVPLIMGMDKKRLSKRHGATSVMEYERMGYLPEALFNFLALLGWGTGSDDELFTPDALVARFTLEGISGGNAVFNTDKLDWFNHQYLLQLGDDALISRLQGRLTAAGYWRDDLFGNDRDWFVAVLALLRPRAKRLNEFLDQLAPFFVDPADYDAEGMKKHLSAPDSPAHVRALRDTLAATAAWDAAVLESALRGLAEARGVKAGTLIHATRLALTGRMVSPGLFEMLTLIGRDRALARLDRLIARL